MLENKALKICDSIEYFEWIFNTDRWTVLSEEQFTFPHAIAILDCTFRYMKVHKKDSLVKKDDGGIAENLFSIFLKHSI